MIRVARDLRIKFDVPESTFYGETGPTDNPLPEHGVAVKHGSASTLRMSQWRLDDLDRRLQLEWPMFSKHVEERDVRDSHGGVVGKEHWGVWKDGVRWRLVTFDEGGEVGYPPTPIREAQLFDQVIGSACFSAGPGH
jgi:hypothetical protein